ncbi:MAG: hypothetical protein ABS81_06480 [Pseudonocardia sp. SCN 72-86]|nr:MAG: hypothetical protein ABS81_06480 [Pseudonocardia sp. SCN 72-86]
MKVEVGAGCVGSGECELVASDVFVVEDDMRAHVVLDDAELSRFNGVIQEAVRACPTAALRVVGDE